MNESIVPDREITINCDGFDIVVNPSASGFGREMYQYGRKRNESEFEHALEMLCFDGMTYVDVGANWGYFTLVVAASCDPGRVVCFEPEEKNVEILSENARINGVDIDLVEKAASDQTSNSVSWERDENLEEPSLGTTEGGDTSVESIRLDEYVAHAGLESIDLLKIDVEGAEGLVLDGLGTEIDRVDGIAVEIHTEAMKAYGHTARNLLEKLLTEGFDLYYTDNNGTVTTIERADLENVDVDDMLKMTPVTVNSVFALRPGSQIESRFPVGYLGES